MNDEYFSTVFDSVNPTYNLTHNDLSSFLENFKDIYPKELELKIEQHGTHATFLDLDIEIKVCLQNI